MMNRLLWLTFFYVLPMILLIFFNWPRRIKDIIVDVSFLIVCIAEYILLTIYFIYRFFYIKILKRDKVIPRIRKYRNFRIWLKGHFHCVIFPICNHHALREIDIDNKVYHHRYWLVKHLVKKLFEQDLNKTDFSIPEIPVLV